MSSEYTKDSFLFYREVLADKARGKRGGRCSRSRTPPVRIPIRKNNKAVNHKNNARAKLFSMPVSPLAKENVKENGSGKSRNNKHNFNENDEAEESDMTNKDEDSDENNPAEPVITLMPYCICAKRPKLSDFREIGLKHYDCTHTFPSEFQNVEKSLMNFCLFLFRMPCHLHRG